MLRTHPFPVVRGLAWLSFVKLTISDIVHTLKPDCDHDANFVVNGGITQSLTWRKSMFMLHIAKVKFVSRHQYFKTLNVRGPSYLGLTRSISWLLMPWLLASPGHQQPWYWLYRMGRSLSYLRKDFNHLCHINVEEWHKCKYRFYVPSEKFSTWRVKAFRIRLELFTAFILTRTFTDISHIVLGGARRTPSSIIALHTMLDRTIWEWAEKED